MLHSPRFLAAVLSCTLSIPAAAQEAPPTTDFLTEFAATARYTSGRPKAIAVTPDGDAVLFLRSGPRSFVQDLISFDPATATERVLLTTQSILGAEKENLTPEELARRERMRMTSRGISSFILSKDGSRILVPLSGRLFVVERATAASREVLSKQGPPIDPQWSPDGTMLSAVRNDEVWITDLATGKEWAVTKGSGGTITNGTAEFVAQEEMSRFHGYWWAPDSKSICYQQTDTAGMETFHIADPMNPAKAPDAWPYPRAGKKNADVKLAIVPVTGGEPTFIEWDRSRFPYVATVTFSPKAPLTILVQNRTQTEQSLLAVDTATGETRPLIRESDPAWINIYESCPVWLADGSGFLWITDAPLGAPEGTDFPRLELRAPDGALISTLTPPGFPLLNLVSVDDDSHSAWVSASPDGARIGIYTLPATKTPGLPVEQHTGNGVYSVTLGDSHTTRVVTASTLAGELSFTVHRPDGKAVGTLTNLAATPPITPKPELTRVKVNAADLNAVILRPRDFDPAKKYPVINQVYGGPGSNTVNAAAMGYLLNQWIANQGYIVVSIDARGTPRRGRAWERVIKNDLITWPLEEQAGAMLALCERYPEMDRDRIGINGWSFGGYFAAMGTMRRPDVFKCGVAGAPVCAWEDYDTHYTERFMDLPDANPAGYTAGNVETWCSDLRVPLMIVHGTADDNVYFLHSLRMTGALFKHGRPFEFVTLPGLTHVVAEPTVVRTLQERIVAFFDRHLRK